MTLMAVGSALDSVIVLVISAPAAATADSNLRSQHGQWHHPGTRGPSR
jgi:hypothetical protein